MSDHFISEYDLIAPKPLERRFVSVAQLRFMRTLEKENILEGRPLPTTTLGVEYVWRRTLLKFTKKIEGRRA
jgi:hypothetical protein